MRSLSLQPDAPVIAGLIVGLFFFIMLCGHRLVRPQVWVYSLVRQAVQAKMNYQSRNMQLCETEHFIIRYTAADRSVIAMVAAAAEQAYSPVTAALGCQPPGKSLIIVYPDKGALRKVFDWPESENAMGVYWGGVIQLLSPRVWMLQPASQEEFITTGPMVHEYTHLVFDYMTNGNYPRWFTEGLAQYMEYRVNGYQWLAANNLRSHRLYSMQELDDHFDRLDNQALAYRESLAAIRYIADNYGVAALRQITAELQAGEDIRQAIRETAGMDYRQYEASWQQWAEATMETNSI